MDWVARVRAQSVREEGYSGRTDLHVRFGPSWVWNRTAQTCGRCAGDHGGDLLGSQVGGAGTPEDQRARVTAADGSGGFPVTRTDTPDDLGWRSRASRLVVRSVVTRDGDAVTR